MHTGSRGGSMTQSMKRWMLAAVIAVAMVIASAGVGAAVAVFQTPTPSDKSIGAAAHHNEWGYENYDDYKDKIKSFDIVRDESWWNGLEKHDLIGEDWSTLDNEANTCQNEYGWCYQWPIQESFCDGIQPYDSGYDRLVQLYQDPDSPDLLLLLSINNANVVDEQIHPNPTIDDITYEQYWDYVSHVVERYDGDGNQDMLGLSRSVKYFEIGNEVDLESTKGFRHSYMTAENYVKNRLIPGYLAAKDANQDSIVMGAGLGMHTEPSEDSGISPEFSTEYLKEMYEKIISTDPNAADHNFYMDKIAMHYYTENANPEYFHENIRSVKELINEYEHKEKPIWITEFGLVPVGLSEDGITYEEEDQAGVLTRFLALMYFNGIEMPIVYQITDFYPHSCQNGNAVFTTRKSIDAKITISNILNGLQPNPSESIIKQPKDGGYLYKIVFSDNSKKVSILWYTKLDGTGYTNTESYSDEKTTYELDISSKSATLIDMLGEYFSDYSLILNSKLNLQVGEKPIYVVEDLHAKDSFGYTYIAAKGQPEDWIEISGTGTEVLSNSDDSWVGNIDLGFFFNYYGTDYSQLAISNNGLLFSGGTTWEYVNEPITQSPSVHGFIAPFWDDIITYDSRGAGTIYYQTLGTAPNRMFIVEWYDNKHYWNSGSGVTFEAILYEGSNNILFQYKDVDFGNVYSAVPGDNPPYDNGGSATVGIEGPTGDDGLQYSFNEQVIDPGLAILFKFPQFAGTNLYLSKQAPASKDRGSTMTYTLHYHNFGDTQAQNVVLEDTLPAEVEFVSASDGGSYNPGTGKVTWNIGSVAPSGHGYRTVTVRILQSAQIGTVIQNDASISTSNLEVRYDDNEAHVQTRVTGSSLPPDVGVEPNNGGTGAPSIYWHNPITFSYHSSDTATGVDIRIHVNDGGPDITGSMAGGPPDWTYTTTFYPRHGRATVTYTVSGESCQAAATLPDGLHLPVSRGLIGLEQHLYNDYPGDGYVPPSGSFPATGLAGVPAGYSTYTLDNGYAGRGAFAPHPSDLSEKYYINMRWPDGVDWSPTQNRQPPIVTDPTTYAKYAHKKVLITAPATGKGLIASIEEAGPALWTGKDAGAPPEVFVALGLYPRGDGQNDPNSYTLNFEWADQSAPLGPCIPTVTFDIYIDPAGYIYDADTGERIAGATVWLQRPDGTGGWENVPIGEVPPISQPDENPLITGADGQYQWDVLAGSYRVHVEASGYYPADSIVVSIPPPVTDLHVGLIPLPDATPPVITNVGAVSDIDSAVITWETDEVSDSLVRYGTSSGSHPFSESGSEMVLSHSITLTGLTPDTLYYYVVSSTDAEGNSAESPEFTFRTLALLDTEPPTIESATLDAYTTIPDATIHVTVEATDNVGVISVTADGVSLVETGSIWEGDITAPSSTGDYTLTIRAEDDAGNYAETTVDYSVVIPTGGLGTAILPKISSASAGSTLPLDIKIVSTENFDDVLHVYPTLDGIPPDYQADLGWFDWTETTVQAPAGGEIMLPIAVDIPDGTSSGYKSFGVKVESTRWSSDAQDYGAIMVS